MKKDARITLRLSETLRADLKELARRNGMFFSEFIFQTLTKAVKTAKSKGKLGSGLF